MKTYRLIFVLTALLLALAGAAVADGTPRAFVPVQEGFVAQSAAELPYHPSRILVKFRPEAMAMSRFELADDTDKAADRDPLRTGMAGVDLVLARAGVLQLEQAWQDLKQVELAGRLGMDRWYMVRTDGSSDPMATVRRLRNDPDVESADVDWKAYPAAVPGDPLHSIHWGHNNTAQMLSYDWGTNSHENGSPVGTVGFDANAHAAWDEAQGYGSAGVVIAILDSGVDVGHPDLRQVTGYDYGDNDSNPDDDSSQAGHGTACAGVAAAMNNGLGAAGMAPGCSIMPLKVANSAGSMYFSAIQNALNYAADNGADIISMSLGAAISSDAATDAAILYAYNAGCTILAATGNENASTISYPAINQYVIGVGAASPCGDRKRSSSSSGEVNPGVSTDPNGYTCDGERWWGSNYGVTTADAAGAVDIIAPTILPTTDIMGSGGYDGSDYSKWFNGTSCSTPYAAGICALIKSANPTWTPAQIRDRLVDTAQDVTSVESGAGWDRYSGYGMVDAAAALAGGTPPVDTVTVSSPNGGETLTAGNVWTVTWGSTGSFSTVAIDYSLNGGSTWNTVTSSTNNDGSYGWTVPSSATTQGRVRITGGTAQDASDGNFTIDVPSGGDYATLPYTTGFEGGSVDQYWTTASNANGRIQVTTANTPHSGSYHLTMDCSSNGTYSTNEGWLHLDLAGTSQVDLDFWWKDFSDETHTADGVYFSDNGGTSFTKVQDLNGGSYTNNSWREWNLDVDALASANGLSLTGTFVVKFQQYDNYMATTDGMAFDDISVTEGGAPAETVTVTSPDGGETLTAGNVWNITWDSTGGMATVAIDYSLNGGTTWSAVTSSTNNDGSHGWTVPSSATTEGRVRVTGGSAVDTSDGNFTIDVPSGGGDYATLPYTAGFEGGAVDQYWTTTSNANGRIQVTTANTPHSGSYHLVMDCSANGTYSTNEAWLHLDLSGLAQVDLDYWWKDFSDETHSTDGVYFSDDGGSSFTKVQDLNGASYTNNVWREWNLDVDALAASNGLSLNGTFVVKFQQYDNYMATTDGMAFDDISVTEGGGGSGGTAITAETEPNADSGSANGPVGEGVAVSGTISSSSDDDWFWFDVTTSGTISISVAIGGSADLDWYLYDSSVTQVDRGYTTSNPEAGTYSASPGRYYLRVDGYNGATSGYTLTVSGGLGASDSGVEKRDVPLAWSLKGNEPNPFNPMTKISYDVPKTSAVQLRIYNPRGQLVRVLVNETVEAGSRTAIWDGRDSAGRQVTSGVYLYVVESEDFRAARKMTLVK